MKMVLSMCFLLMMGRTISPIAEEVPGAYKNNPTDQPFGGECRGYLEHYQGLDNDFYFWL